MIRSNNRDWNIRPAETDSREPRIPQLVSFSLDDIIGHFNESLSEIDNAITIAEKSIGKENKGIFDTFLRCQVVLIESAFDFYMHELTRFGLTAIHEKEWKETEKYLNLQITMKELNRLIAAENHPDAFAEIISTKFSFRSFISPDEVKGLFKMLGIKYKDIADKAFYLHDDTKKTMDKMNSFLRELMDCRNMIAHQAGRNPRNAMQEPVSLEKVREYQEGITRIVAAIDEQARIIQIQ